MSARRIAIGVVALAAIVAAVGIAVMVRPRPDTGPAGPTGTPAAAPEPSPAAGGALAPSTVQAVEAALAEWVAAWRGVDSAFDLRAFRSTQTGPIEYASALPFEPGNPSFVRARMPDYAYTPDRTRFVDPYIDLGPDTAVAVVDLTRKTWRRLLFCGTPCGFDGAAWLSADVLVVVGYAEPPGGPTCASPRSATCPSTPLLWLFDFSRDVRAQYEAPTAPGNIYPTYTRKKIDELPAN